MNQRSPYEFENLEESATPFSWLIHSRFFKVFGPSLLICSFMILMFHFTIPRSLFHEDSGQMAIFAAIGFVPFFRSARSLQLVFGRGKGAWRSLLLGIGGIGALIGSFLVTAILFGPAKNVTSLVSYATFHTFAFLVLRRILFGQMRFLRLLCAIGPTSIVSITVLVEITLWVHDEFRLWSSSLVAVTTFVSLYTHIFCAAWWLAESSSRGD